MSRQCSNWLLSLREYGEETETPHHFWTWAGMFTLSAALQRKVWTPFGQKKLFPNLYVMIIAPPGVARKSPPIRFARNILKELEIPVFVDSASKRAFTMDLDSIGKDSHFDYKTPEGPIVTLPQSPLSCISPELSSFLAIDIKNMIEILTDIYDCDDTWTYKTAGKGEDTVLAPYVTCLFASTPSWIAGNLPSEAIGGGFTRRCVVVFGDEAKKQLSLPPPPPTKVYQALLQDLGHIKRIVGEFSWSSAAFEFYDAWYHTLKQKIGFVQDERIQPFLSEVHSIAIKTSMCAHVAKSDTLVIELDDMQLSIALLEKVIETAHQAFSSHGRSSSAIDTDRVMMQVKMFESKGASEADLLRMNYRNTNRDELRGVLDTLDGMDKIVRKIDTTNGRERIYWKGEKE